MGAMPASAAALSVLMLAASAKPPQPEAVVLAYLNALKELDGQRMLNLLASAVADGKYGKPQPVETDRVLSMRGFERAMRTQWSWTLGDRHGHDVSVSLREVNDFYEALGVGVCRQTVVYSVTDGKISSIETKEISYGGRPYREAFPAFEAWLLRTPAGSDPTIVRDGHLLFTSASARALEPWLRAWRERSGSGR